MTETRPKRSYSTMESNQDEGLDQKLRFQTMFEGFRAELDEHHDRRERVVKASRDITAASKKLCGPSWYSNDSATTN